MLAVVGVRIWAGVHNLRERRAAMANARANEVVLTKANAPSDGMDGMAAPSIRGQVAPGFTLVDLNGKKVSLADYKGHPVVVNFWATYCGPCKLEMPWFQEMIAKYQSSGLVVLGLDEDEGVGKDQIAAAAKKVGYLPETFYVARDGKVVEQTFGVSSKDELEADVRKAIQ
jgi:thiol-disulfide isomerase/thioredoxin